MKRFRYIIRQLLITLLVAELCIPVLPLYAADITIDTTVPAGNRPTIDSAQNGVTIINLAATTAGGVSHNKFENYNVGTNGIILNNSYNMGVSVLGGAIYGNPNYQSSGKEASIVLNEVTGTRRSNILGYTEMFGKSAEFILVNPNGILLNGAGFINMPRVTLGTGIPVFDSGIFKGINISGGSVVVEGDGIDAGKVNYFDIITRMTCLNASVWGNEVNINTGTGYYNYGDKTFTQNSTGSEKPEFGIDASVLGSIYAGRITLISNENGVGVRSKAGMLANVSDIRITADGKIELKNAQTADNISVTSTGGSISQSGDVFAMGNIDYTALGITNRGTIKALRDIALSGLIDNQNGEISGRGNIDLNTGGNLTNLNGKISTGSIQGSIYIHGDGNLTVDGGAIESAGTIGFDMGGGIVLSGNTGSIYADRDLTITAKNFTNSMYLSTNGSVGLNVAASVNISSGGGLVTNSNINIDAGCMVANSGNISGDSIEIKGGSLANGEEGAISGGNSGSVINLS